MARARTTTLWMYVEKECKQRYVRVVKSANGRWVPKVDEPYKPGSYYLRYRTNDKRVWESVGTDLQVALAEQKARQAMVTNERQQQPVTTRKTLAAAIDAYVSEVRTRRSNKAAKRAKWLLDLFASVTNKHYVDEITRDTPDASESGAPDALLITAGRKSGRKARSDARRGPDSIVGRRTSGGKNRSPEIAPVMHFPNSPQ